MTRVLVVHAGNMYGGVERVLETLAQSPALGADIDPSFALCFEGPLSSSLRTLGHEPDMLGGVRVTRPVQVHRARKRLAAVLDTRSSDVVLTQSAWAHAIFAPVVRRHRLPLVMWVHDQMTGSSWLEKLAGRYPPDLLLCNSLFSQRAAATVFPSTPSTMIRCPLIFKDSRETRHEVRTEVRRMQGVSDETPVIICVARMDPYKGHHALIEALSRLDGDLPWACWIVGGSQRAFEREYEKSLHDAVRTRALQNRVTFLGHRDDVASLLQGADVFCHPTQASEPFGLAIVEALHAGLPVVASGQGGPREILTEACGRWVPGGDPSALADALSSLLTSPARRSSMVSAAVARALELCDPLARLSELTAALAHIALKAA
jgi:glycosyltransferase involved in cell wall biosynthesis